jgi:hypothetical protein
MPCWDCLGMRRNIGGIGLSINTAEHRPPCLRRAFPSRLLHPPLCLPSTSTLNPHTSTSSLLPVCTPLPGSSTKYDQAKQLPRKCYVQHPSSRTKCRITRHTRHRDRHHYLSAPETCNLKSSTSPCLRLSRNNQPPRNAHSSPTQ